MSAVAREPTTDTERDRFAWNLPRPRPKRAVEPTPLVRSEHDDPIGSDASPESDDAAA